MMKRHLIKNEDERLILLQLASQKIGIRTSPCPVTGCGHHKLHLQRHLVSGHRDFTVEEREKWTQRARVEVAKSRLAALRATNPAVPMRTKWEEERFGVQVQDQPQVVFDVVVFYCFYRTSHCNMA